MPDISKYKAGLIIVMTILALLFLLGRGEAREYSNNEIANAIYKAENSVKYPYGIKSIPTYGNKDYARKICLHTIRNHRIRHANHKCGLEFLLCLSNRYCPPTAHKLNKNWVSNVRYWLARSPSVK